MYHSARNGRATRYAHRWHHVTSRVFLQRLRTKFAATLLLATTSFAVTANAVEANVRDDLLSALRDYVQLIDTGRRPLPTPSKT